MIKPIQEVIDKALDLGGAYDLSDKKIEYLIKAIAQDRFGDDVNYKLQKFKMKIIEEDKEGIDEANEFLKDIFKEFLDCGDEKVISVLNRRRQERKSRENRDN